LFFFGCHGSLLVLGHIFRLLIYAVEIIRYLDIVNNMNDSKTYHKIFEIFQSRHIELRTVISCGSENQF
jgi:hypothetical protein